MLGKISGRFVMPERYNLYKSDAGAEIVFKVDEVNDGVYLSDLNAYLITIGVEEERNKYLLSKTVENNVLSLSFAVSKLVTKKSGNVTAQIVFESAGGEVIYHTMIFYISVKNSVSGYSEPSEPLPSAITSLQNSLALTIEQCKELKNDYLSQAEEYRKGKEIFNAEKDKLDAPYALIEKVITGYTALTAEPEDFATNYANYYKTNGKARNDKDFNYVALTEAETFEAGKFYSYIDEASNLIRASGKEPDGTAYSFKNLYIYGETKDESTYFADYGWAYFYVNNERRTNNTPFVYFSVAKSKSHRAQMFVNAQGNSVMAYTTDLGSHYLENHGNKTDVSSLQFRDALVTITGVDISSLPAGTTILIYGVRK